MSFLAPLWLGALGVLLVPLAIHLLGRGRPPRVAVGSVRLLAAGAVRVPRRARLQRPWLLLLRCALLATLVVALAGPRVRARGAGDEPARPWVLVEPGLPAATVAAELAPAAGDDGPEVRWLAPGLPAVRAAGNAAGLPPPAAVAGGTWSLLREADAVAPAGVAIRVLTSGRLAALDGVRPRFARPVRWEVVAAPTRAAMPGSAAGAASAAPREAGDAVGRARPVRAAVWAPADRAEDAAYVRAALRALAAEPGLELLPAATPPAAAAAGSGAPPQLLIWLGDAPAPAALLAAVGGGATLVRDASPAAGCADTLRLPGGDVVAWQRCAAPPAGAVPLWRGDTGRTLLAASPHGAGRVLHLAARFHPTSSDLVLSPAFPRWLRSLVAAAAVPAAGRADVATRGEALAAGAADPASDGGQGRPGQLAAAAAAPPSAGPRAAEPPATSPAAERALWLLLPLLLLAERWLATRSA